MIVLMTVFSVRKRICLVRFRKITHVVKGYMLIDIIVIFILLMRSNVNKFVI